MIQDDILKEIRAVREEYARLHDFDVYKIVADLQATKLPGDWKIVRLSPRTPRVAVATAPESGPKS